jgi:hypothetical protein
MTFRSVPKTHGHLGCLAKKAALAAAELELELDLHHNRSVSIVAEIEDLWGGPGVEASMGKEGILMLAREREDAAAAARRLAFAAARAFNAKAVDCLKSHFGRSWNERWMQAGITGGSLQQPYEPADWLTRLRDHFRSNPQHEHAGFGITAREADRLNTELYQAISEENAAMAARRDARQARDAAFEKLRRRMVGLRAELEQLLEPTDNRWIRFGFRRPVDRHIPEEVEGIEVHDRRDPGGIVVQWERSTGADSYRVSTEVEGSMEGPVEAGIFAGRTVLISGLPPGAEVVVRITARNSAGETRPASARFRLRSAESEARTARFVMGPGAG